MADERKRIIEFDSAEEVYSDAQLAMDSASQGTKKISPTLLLQGLTDAVDGLTDSLSDEYNSAATYAVGDYCIYNNRLYKCTTAISTTEAWNPSHWTPTSCDTELSELKSSLGNLFQITNRGAKSDLNDIPTTAGTVSVTTFNSSTTNIPVSGSGYCFTFLNADSALYGRQIVVMNNGIYSRKLQNGTWNVWQYVNMTNQT